MSISHLLLELVERFGSLSTSLERCCGVRIERCKNTGSGFGSQRQRSSFVSQKTAPGGGRHTYMLNLANFFYFPYEAGL